jgi:hypothetical protein
VVDGAISNITSPSWPGVFRPIRVIKGWSIDVKAAVLCTESYPEDVQATRPPGTSLFGPGTPHYRQSGDQYNATEVIK